MHAVHGWLNNRALKVTWIGLFVLSVGAYVVNDTRLWCGVHPTAVVRTGEAPGMPATRVIRHKAEVEEAALVFDWARAMALTDAWVSGPEFATEVDPHQGWGSVLSWETEAPAQFAIACAGARLGLGS